MLRVGLGMPTEGGALPKELSSALGTLLADKPVEDWNRAACAIYTHLEQLEGDLQGAQRGLLPAIPRLVAMLAAAATFRWAAGALCNLCFLNPEVANSITLGGGVRAAVKQLGTLHAKPGTAARTHPDGQPGPIELALDFLNNTVASSYDMHLQLVQEGLLEELAFWVAHPDKAGPTLHNALLAITSFCCNPLSRKAAITAGFVPLLEPHVNELVAILALAYLVGGVDEDAGKCAMKPRHVDQLLAAIRAAKDGKGYNEVRWSLWKLLMGLARLAVNETNKAHLFECDVVGLLCSAIDKFPEDASVGRYASETLLQLSFSPAAKRWFTSPVLTTVQALRRRLSEDPHTTQNIGSLLFVLKGKGVVPPRSSRIDVKPAGGRGGLDSSIKKRKQRRKEQRPAPSKSKSKSKSKKVADASFEAPARKNMAAPSAALPGPRRGLINQDDDDDDDDDDWDECSCKEDEDEEELEMGRNNDNNVGFNFVDAAVADNSSLNSSSDSDSESDTNGAGGGGGGSAGDGRPGHLMISYNWASQSLAVKLAQMLKVNDYKVWIDLEQMTGSTLQAMAEAVEQSTLVLVLFSQQYKDSANCRLEAEYAFSQNKKIVPVLVEGGYSASGWLGALLGTKLYYDISAGLGQEVFAQLCRELQNAPGKEPDAKPIVHHVPTLNRDLPTSGSSQPAATHSTAPGGTARNLAKIQGWSAADVAKWARSCGVPEAVRGLSKHKVDGRVLCSALELGSGLGDVTSFFKAMGVKPVAALQIWFELTRVVEG